MPLPIFPNPISLQDLQDTFGGTNPIGMNEYYRGGTRVANIPDNSKVPTSGTISIEDFYGATGKITVVNDGTLLNVNMQTAFTINGVNYWNRNIEKEYINNGTIGSNSATSPALTVSGGRVGTFTLRNTGSILGAGGNGATTGNGQVGGTAISNNSSNYTLINTGFIYGGGGGGARGRNGGTGGTGGTGRYITSTVNQTNTITVTRGGSCASDAFSAATGSIPCNTARVVNPGNSRSYNWCAGAPPPLVVNGVSYNYTYVPNSQQANGSRICRYRVSLINYDYYGMSRRYRVTYPVYTYGNVAGCTGVSGTGTGGAGGKGQGYDNQLGPSTGSSGAAVTNTTNCCANNTNGRGAGCGGARGKGGNGSSGGTWGQPGGNQETNSATSGQSGLSGYNNETKTSTPGSPGSAPGGASTPGQGGFYLSGSTGNTITFTNTGTVLGRLS